MLEIMKYICGNSHEGLIPRQKEKPK